VESRSRDSGSRGRVPDMTETPYRPLIRRQVDLERAWRRLMGPGDFSHHSLWLMVVLADDRPFPHLVEIDEAVEPPDPDEVAGFARFLRHLVIDMGEGSRVALLRSRPGPPGVTDEDRAWAQATYAACRPKVRISRHRVLRTAGGCRTKKRPGRKLPRPLCPIPPAAR